MTVWLSDGDKILAAQASSNPAIGIVLTIIIILISISSTIISLIAMNRSSQRGVKTDVVEMERRLTTVEVQMSSAPKVIERITSLETKMELFWNGLAVDAAKMLHKPHPEFAVRDTLLERFMENRLDREGAKRLLNMLLQVVDTKDGDTTEKIAAGILIRTLRHDFKFGD